VWLERLSAPPNVRERASGPIVSPARGSDYDIPLMGDRKHLIVTPNGSITGPMLIDTGASY